jgi:hypothetical protein
MQNASDQCAAAGPIKACKGAERAYFDKLGNRLGDLAEELEGTSNNLFDLVEKIFGAGPADSGDKGVRAVPSGAIGSVDDLVDRLEITLVDLKAHVRRLDSLA